MAKYFLTNKAIEDLSKIWDYTFEAWSESQADKYYEMLINFFKALAKHPEKGKHYSEIDEHLLGFRVNKHIIFYRKTSSNEIEVLRILHEKMDLKRRMQDE